MAAAVAAVCVCRSVCVVAVCQEQLACHWLQRIGEAGSPLICTIFHEYIQKHKQRDTFTLTPTYTDTDTDTDGEHRDITQRTTRESGEGTDGRRKKKNKSGRISFGWFN